MTNKKCSSCKRALPVSSFPKLKQGPRRGKPGKVCRDCRQYARPVANGAEPPATKPAVPEQLRAVIMERVAEKLAERIWRGL
jgi:hypothetical protein